MQSAVDPSARLRLQRGVEQLHRRGPRTPVVFLAEIAGRIGRMLAILALLAGSERRLTPLMLHAAGGR
jgi:hypothetical protein